MILMGDFWYISVKKILIFIQALFQLWQHLSIILSLGYSYILKHKILQQQMSHFIEKKITVQIRLISWRLQRMEVMGWDDVNGKFNTYERACSFSLEVFSFSQNNTQD